MKKVAVTLVVIGAVIAGGIWWWQDDENREAIASIKSCKKLVKGGFLKIADDRSRRFLGKVEIDTARCRGGERATQAVKRHRPWLDWSSYWGAADADSRVTRYDKGALRKIVGKGFEKLHVDPNLRGIDGALIDLEYERIELIKFNLFDNYTFETYLSGKDGLPGPAVDQWDEMRLPPDHPNYADVGGDGKQTCGGELIRFRTVSGICNDIINPLMGSSNTLFARNVQFSETFPDKGLTVLTKARHGGRINLMTPDPQVISRELFTRRQSKPDLCKKGEGLENYSPTAHCDYKPAPFFNVLAAFWIQFMTHDWFSHLVEGENDRNKPLRSAGCDLDEAQAQNVGCRRGDQIEEALVADSSAPPPSSMTVARTWLGRIKRSRTP